MRQVRFCIVALVVALTIGLFPLGTTSLAVAQEAVRTDKIDATWDLLTQMKRRQIRQDRILGLGFGVTALLLIGLTAVCLRRSIILRSTESKTNPLVVSKALALSFEDRVARLRLSAKLASMARRQKRIENLMTEMKAAISDNIETAGLFRGALDKLLEEVARIDNEFNDTLAGSEQLKTTT